MHVTDLKLSVVRVGHRVPVEGFCLSLYSLRVQYRDVNFGFKQPNNFTRSHFEMFVTVLI